MSIVELQVGDFVRFVATEGVSTDVGVVVSIARIAVDPSPSYAVRWEDAQSGETYTTSNHQRTDLLFVDRPPASHDPEEVETWLSQ